MADFPWLDEIIGDAEETWIGVGSNWEAWRKLAAPNENASAYYKGLAERTWRGFSRVRMCVCAGGCPITVEFPVPPYRRGWQRQLSACKTLQLLNLMAGRVLHNVRR